ncbi:uncharacterized protein LOC124927044 [Impatiens glandulifera]|uniref:uncharacterized protein LOC124927044 n=1 Tax=Impatiens glandulifera TaxID=253017 RepID=UPI001FB061B1|nr:uncharacterized protein LOC124927044 [Impatiens glandulifera]
MSSLSTVGFALSLVFGFLFLALIAELYYLLWWKKRIINSVDVKLDDCINNNNNSPRRRRDGELMYMSSSCWTKPSFLVSKALDPQRLCSSAIMADTQVYEPQSLSYPNQNNIWFREEDDDDDDEDDQHSTLSVPPRFLFTIVEETKEDLESEDGGSLSRRFSDLVLTIETTPPYLTPLASPTAYFTPPLTPLSSNNGFNPLFESSNDVEIRRIKSSPPPKFNFLKDAEEKLFRTQIRREEEDMGIGSSSSDPSLFLKDHEEINRCFISSLVVSRRVQFHGSSSQVLPV